MSAAAATPPPPPPLPTRPYLLRAIYQWAVDQHLTPQLLVDAAAEGVLVPPERVVDGRIVLNIHPQAVTGLDMGNQVVSFAARFGGRSIAVSLPIAAVVAIYCRENGRGIIFPDEVDIATAATAADNHAANAAVKPPRPSPAPHLKLVK